ncbi:hypothetical protein BDZ89DRAFT_1056977 [Hymenopellis radicata]|nr:hypothetical protein BDZ89DRAFT_1056977 [Hymenopellis radicata]
MDSLRSSSTGGLSGSPPRLDADNTLALAPSFLPANADQERRFNESAASAQAAQLAEDGDRPRMSVTRGSAGMKWNTFVKVMKDAGFTHVPSETGSSVRFDPPNGTERSITFHKPHPDSFIHAKLMKEFSKKFNNYYGWLPDRLAGY